MATETKGNNKLSRMDLFSMAIGQIIGVGIMTMTGIAIGFTGRSVPFAYILACILTVVSAVPQIFIGGTANFLGGQYSQIAVLGNKKLAAGTPMSICVCCSPFPCTPCPLRTTFCPWSPEPMEKWSAVLPCPSSS